MKKYIGVRPKRMRYSHVIKYEAYGIYHGSRWSKICDTEREAAIAVDLFNISNGKQPKNILKRM